MIAVESSLQQLKQAVKQLSTSEKLVLNEAIWAEDMSIPKDHQTIVSGRVKNAMEKPDTLLDWDVASKTLHA